MDTVNKYIETHRERFLDELFELIRIPSVSADQSGRNEMIKTAELVESNLLKAGADSADVM